MVGGDIMSVEHGQPVEKWLEEFLADGPRLATDVERLAFAQIFSHAEVVSAARSLGIEFNHTPDGLMWSLKKEATMNRQSKNIATIEGFIVGSPVAMIKADSQLQISFNVEIDDEDELTPFSISVGATGFFVYDFQRYLREGEWVCVTGRVCVPDRAAIIVDEHQGSLLSGDRKTEILIKDGKAEKGWR